MVSGANSPRASVLVPEDAAGESIHIILKVTDAGRPSLTRYRRVIVSCQPTED